MMDLTTAKNIAFKSSIGLLTLVIIFHGFIIVKIIPYNIAWGGRLENDSQMYVFESISIFINGFLITVLFLRANYIKHQFSEKILNGVLRFFQVLFILNTVGNVMAKTNFEKFFAFLTLLLAILIEVILRGSNDNNVKENSIQK